MSERGNRIHHMVKSDQCSGEQGEQTRAKEAWRSFTLSRLTVPRKLLLYRWPSFQIICPPSNLFSCWFYYILIQNFLCFSLVFLFLPHHQFPHEKRLSMWENLRSQLENSQQFRKCTQIILEKPCQSRHQKARICENMTTWN